MPQGVLEGEHTLTIVGISRDGEEITTSLGIVIAQRAQPEAAEVVSTDSSDGFGLAEGLLWAALLLFIGLSVALVNRRRKSA